MDRILDAAFLMDAPMVVDLALKLSREYESILFEGELLNIHFEKSDKNPCMM